MSKEEDKNGAQEEEDEKAIAAKEIKERISSLDLSPGVKDFCSMCSLSYL